MSRESYAAALKARRRKRKVQKFSDGGESGGTASPASTPGGYSYGAYSGSGGTGGNSASSTSQGPSNQPETSMEAGRAQALMNQARYEEGLAKAQQAESARESIDSTGKALMATGILAPIGAAARGLAALGGATVGSPEAEAMAYMRGEKGNEAISSIPGYQGSAQPQGTTPALQVPPLEVAALGPSVEEQTAAKLKKEAELQNASTLAKITGSIGPWQTPVFARGGIVPKYAGGGTTGLAGTKVDPASVDAAQSTFQARQAGLDEISGYGNAVAGGAQGVQAAQTAAGETATGQKALAAQLAQQVLGQGPNPALEQLKQTTGQNIQQATGMIASQKGINPALAARVAALAGANANQTAAGQAATQAAQQQLAAQNLQAQSLSTQRAQDIAQQQASLGLMTGAGTLQQQQNAQRIQNLAQAQALNQSTAAQNAALQTQAGSTTAQLANQAAIQNAGTNTAILGGVLNAGAGIYSSFLARGGTVPRRSTDFRAGGPVPGQAKAPGDSEVNDTVPALVSPGEIVIPRSKAQAPDAPEQAAAFVAALKNRKRESMPESGYGRVLAKQREIERRLAQLERMSEGGEVEDDEEEKPGVVESIKRWFRSSPEDESTEAAKDVDESLMRNLPKPVNASEALAVYKKRRTNLLEENWKRR
jgi:hypothetical protein